MTSTTQGKPRPALFRALGRSEPPPHVEIAGKAYHHVETLKHDSWAATAIYAGPAGTIICKFNRQQSILGIPMRWLGRRLAAREMWFYRRLADLPCIPAPCGPVSYQGKVLPYAAAHRFVEGHALRHDDKLPPAFFAELNRWLSEIHYRGIAYMDLHKRENILLGEDGRGYLIDFQVSFGITPTTWFAPARWLLALFQSGDRYHMFKHQLRQSTLTSAERETLIDRNRPWWLRVHRVFAQPLRQMRRKLLVLLGIRKGAGLAQSEHFTEDGLREVKKAA